MTFETFMGSIPGPYHVKEGLPNQDALLFHEEKGIVFAAVADGAGSLKFSDQGSHLAVETAVNFMTDNRKKLELEELVKSAYEVARDKLQSIENYQEYGATLSLVALKETGEAATAALGDSFIVLHENEELHHLVTGTPSGEYANITQLLTSQKQNPIFSSFENIRGASLSSDGLERVAIQNGEAFSGFWGGIYKQAQAGSLHVDKLFRWLASQDKIEDDTSLLTLVSRYKRN